jgi:hypothetical protein
MQRCYSIGSTGALVVLLALVTVSCRPRIVCFPLEGRNFSRKVEAPSFDPADVRVVPMASRWDRVVGPGISGAVLPTSEYSGYGLENERFVPSEDEIRTCEVMIHEALTKRPFCGGQIGNLDRHFRHYAGGTVDGARRVIIRFTCGEAAADHRTIIVDDGGPCFAVAVCDAEAQRLVRFECNWFACGSLSDSPAGSG